MTDSKNVRLIKTLVLIAIVFSFLAVIAGNPYTVSIVPVDTDEEFEIEGNVVKVIAAGDLAARLIAKRNDFNLFDIRSDSDFKEYHIPHSINISSENFTQIKQDEASIIIIYDEGNRYVIGKIKPLVKDVKADVYLLKGGIRGWMNEVLFPDLRNTKLSKDETDKIYKTSSFFGGKPVTDKERKRKKYSREGC